MSTPESKGASAAPMTHWRRHDECVVETYDTYIEDDPKKGISGHGAHAVNATACGRLASHNDTTPNPTEADCPECVGVYETDYQPGLVRQIGAEESEEMLGSVGIMLHGLSIGDWRRVYKGLWCVHETLRRISGEDLPDYLSPTKAEIDTRGRR